MHNSSRVLNIVVLGCEHSGKSTLIDSIVFDPNRDGELPRVLKPKEFSLQLKNQDITFNFIDTNSEKPIQQAFSTMPVLSADLFVFVLDSTNEEGVKKFHEEWLPYIEKSKKMLYIILTKTDLISNPEDPDLFDPTQAAEKYIRYQGLFKYSSKTRENIEMLLFNLSNIFIFSADFLYNFVEERLTSQCHKALRRIFWLMDELNCELVDNSTIKDLIDASAEDTVVLDENGSMNLDSFLSFMISLILTRHEHLVWNLIQKFGYNEKLELEIDNLIADVSPDISHEDFITLSDNGKTALTNIFNRFDKDNDGLLDENDIDEAFSLTTACPFHEMSTNYFDSCRTVDDKKIDIHSWISLWQLIVTTNCYRYIHCLYEWGCNNVEGMIEVKKKRLFRKSPEDYPNILNCYIFGASNCGKTSVLRHFVGKAPLTTHYSTKSTQYSVVDRIMYQNREYHLIVTEFEDKEIPFVLKSEELMGKCDVALLVFDGSDKFSFSFLEHIQRGLEVTIPCVYMLTKKDLGLVDQENLSVTPEQFCEALSLVWPPYLCSLVSEDGLKNIKTLFSDLLEVALNPKESGCVPNWNMNNEDESDEELELDDEDFPPKESLMKRTLKMVGVVSVFGFVAFAMMKLLKRAKE